MDPTLTVLRITSPRDLGNSRRLKKTVGHLLKDGRCNIVLVLHHDGNMEYEHIECLDALEHKIRRAGGSLSIVVMRQDLRFVFRLLRLGERFNVVERVDDIPRLPPREHPWGTILP